MTERFRFLQGEFRRLRAASDFLDAQKSPKKRQGAGAIGGSATPPASMSPVP